MPRIVYFFSGTIAKYKYDFDGNLYVDMPVDKLQNLYEMIRNSIYEKQLECLAKIHPEWHIEKNEMHIIALNPLNEAFYPTT